MSSIVYCNRVPNELHGHLAVIDGKKTTTGKEFLRCIWEQLSFPDKEHQNWDAYLDWMRDLSWMQSKQISIVILNFEAFLSKEPNEKNAFASDLEEDVFPFWEKDAEEVFGNKEEVKDIFVYCISAGDREGEQCPTIDAVSTLRQMALNGQKAPHSTAQPVLREQDGKIYFAAFVFFFNREEIQSAMVHRPELWILGDLRTGEVSQRYSCSVTDFSACDHEKLYNISPEGLGKIDDAYWFATYALMDLIRNEYLQYGVLRRDLYKKYLARICNATPEEYRVFYKELSNIGLEDETMDEQNVVPVEETAKPEAEQVAPEQVQPEAVPVEETKAEEVAPAEQVAPADQSAVLEKLEAVQAALAALQETFDEKIAEDTHKNGLFDNMHRELIKLQNGAVEKIIDTVALDIIQLIDTTKGHVRVYEQKEVNEENYKKLLRIIKGIAQDMEDILYRQNIESYRVTGHEVDVRRQKIIQTVPTDDPSKDNLVAVRAADGYEKGDKVLRHERIKIFKYEAPTETPSEN